MRVLIVEDDFTSAIVLENFLREQGYEVGLAENGRVAYEMIRRQDYRIVISDWQMPEMDGLELCRQIRSRKFGAYVYIILLTCRSGHQNLVDGLNAGADDFISKPFIPDELRVRLHAGARVASIESRDLVIFSLAKLAESRDPETGAHLERVREYVRMLAEELSNTERYKDVIDADYVRTLYLTSPLHDIGKVGIPDDVLLKPGRLTPKETESMQLHAVIGSSTLQAALRAHPSAGFLRMARDIAWSHHERYDGAGYPRRLKGDEIPLCGRIMAVADVYDALTTKRVYKPAFSHETSKEIIVQGRGSQFDPDVVDAFVACETGFLEVRRLFDDAGDGAESVVHDNHTFELFENLPSPQV